MVRKGYRRITCPVCGTWLFLRPVTHHWGQRIDPPLDPPEYHLTIYHSWHCSDEQATRIANCPPAGLAQVRGLIRAESLELKAKWDRLDQQYKLNRALDAVHAEIDALALDGGV